MDTLADAGLTTCGRLEQNTHNQNNKPHSSSIYENSSMINNNEVVKLYEFISNESVDLF